MDEWFSIPGFGRLRISRLPEFESYEILLVPEDELRAIFKGRTFIGLGIFRNAANKARGALPMGGYDPSKGNSLLQDLFQSVEERLSRDEGLVFDWAVEDRMIISAQSPQIVLGSEASVTAWFLKKLT